MPIIRLYHHTLVLHIRRHHRKYYHPDKHRFNPPPKPIVSRDIIALRPTPDPEPDSPTLLPPWPTFQPTALVLYHEFWRENPFDNTFAYWDDLFVFIPNVDADGHLAWADLLVPFLQYWNRRERLRIGGSSRI